MECYYQVGGIWCQLPACYSHRPTLGVGEGMPAAPHSTPLPAHRLEYLQQKQSRANSEAEKQVLEKQAKEAEREVQDIR